MTTFCKCEEYGINSCVGQQHLAEGVACYLMLNTELKKDAAKSGLVKKLEEAIKTAESREAVYGKGHVGHSSHGAMLSALFPNGITLTTPDDFTRFILFIMLTTKLARYAKNFDKGGHKDSAHDAGVYSFILEDYDDNANNRK